MTIDQMIEILEAYKRGEKIEYSWDGGERWAVTDFPTWNFDTVQYRIAKPEPKKVKLEAWLMAGEIRWLTENSQLVKFANDPIRIPEEDKEITLP